MQNITKRKKAKKEKPQKCCTRMATIGRHIYFFIWELNPAHCDPEHASFGAKGLTKV
jgi:hypothetical protein